MTLYIPHLLADDPRMPAGNWHPFPPPEVGFYNVRQVIGSEGLYTYNLYANKRVYEGLGKRLLCMGRRVQRMRASEGWQFQFLQELTDGKPTLYRPFAVLYDIRDGIPVATERRDVSAQLPTARSRNEALYIVRSMPERWPVFVRIHIEYTETVLQS